MAKTPAAASRAKAKAPERPKTTALIPYPAKPAVTERIPLDAIDGNRNPVTNGREALKVQVLIEALLRSAEEGRAIRVA